MSEEEGVEGGVPAASPDVKANMASTSMGFDRRGERNAPDLVLYDVVNAVFVRRREVRDSNAAARRGSAERTVVGIGSDILADNAGMTSSAGSARFPIKANELGMPYQASSKSSNTTSNIVGASAFSMIADML